MASYLKVPYGSYASSTVFTVDQNVPVSWNLVESILEVVDGDVFGVFYVPFLELVSPADIDYVHVTALDFIKCFLYVKAGVLSFLLWSNVLVSGRKQEEYEAYVDYVHLGEFHAAIK